MGGLGSGRKRHNVLQSDLMQLDIRILQEQGVRTVANVTVQRRDEWTL